MVALKKYAKVFKSDMMILEITEGENAPELPPEELSLYQIIEVGPHAEVGTNVRLTGGMGDPPHATPETHPVPAPEPEDPPITRSSSKSAPKPPAEPTKL